MQEALKVAGHLHDVGKVMVPTEILSKPGKLSPIDSGYPRGLKGEAILGEARILAVADVVEAMSSHRPYRPGLGILRLLRERNYRLAA